ncbi:MAG: LCP family protein [Candidatus Saganbacteria bacterium]|nr:LCP family protein [Candidatus Saganbacteria bacterium]
MSDKQLFPEIAARSGLNSSGKAWTKLLIFFTVILVVLSAFLGFTASFILSRISVFEMLFTLSPSNVQFPEMNILLLGIDATEGVNRSDTIMVMHIDPESKTVSIVSIPRDTLVVIPGIRIDKINHAYAFGGPELACATTSSFLNVPINYYIKIKVDGLANIIDRLGGVMVDVDQRMYYVDYAGGLFIDLKPGVQRLNGKQAIGYLRFRHDAKGDFGRIKRQQKFLQEVVTEMAGTKNIVQVYQLLMDMLGCVETNLSTSQILGLASMVRQSYEIGNIAVVSIPGTSTRIDGIYYLQPEMDKVIPIVDQYLRGRRVNEIPKETAAN